MKKIKKITASDVVKFIEILSRFAAAAATIWH